MVEFVQAIFEEISLERNPALWQSEKDSREETAKRIKFLAEFSETSFTKVLKPEKSPGRKNNQLAKALEGKADKAGSPAEALRLISQALCFAEELEVKKSLLRKRILLLQDFHEKEKKEHTATALTLLGKERTNEEEELLSELLQQENENQEEKSSLIGSQRHPKLPVFSNSVKLESQPGRGRFLVAATDIFPGECIAEETSFASILDAQFSPSRCNFCSAPAPQPVPCPNCATARFCSLACRERAISSYHKYECLLQDTLAHSGTGAWPLAFRLVATQPLAKWNSLKLGTPDESLGLESGEEEEEEVYNSKDIRTVHSLVTHAKGAHRSAPALMKEALTALFFLRLLQLRSYCSPSNIPSTLSSEELQTALLLHHFMRVVFYNSHEASALVANPQNCKKVSKIGVAINPSLALINHSCDPNYGRVSRGSTVLGFATRFIKEGEEVTDVYSGTAAKSAKEEREEVHSRYNFKCCCRACKDGWPTQEKLPRNVTMRQAQKGAHEKDVKQVDRELKEVTRDGWSKKMEPAASLQRLSSILTKASGIVSSPNLLVSMAEEELHSMLWNIHG